ncbi:RxLR effector protein [Phytophthora megakarya]|uniref:RxLR effector protein n=1 Tax=Phytophthora megakarya TaxID=4795 RepID=A0A225W5T6_9STRA|nr:RxLR effector protein [Phytophthora megakarya]
MRLQLWILFTILATCLSSAEAALSSTTKSIQQALATKVASPGLIDSNNFNDSKRHLRGDSNELGNVNDDEEQRGIEKLTNLFKEIKAKYLAWEQTQVIPRFIELAKEGVTVSALKNGFFEQFRWAIPMSSMPSGYKRFARLYEVWLRKNHPSLAV